MKTKAASYGDIKTSVPKAKMRKSDKVNVALGFNVTTVGKQVWAGMFTV